MMLNPTPTKIFHPSPHWLALCLTWRAFLLSAWLLACVPSLAAEDNHYDLHYAIELQPAKHSALVTISVDDARLLRELDFNIDDTLHSDIAANGKLRVENGRAVWVPPKRNARLTLRATISHERAPGKYDALITDDWAIFRGDDLVPPAVITTAGDAHSRATLTFKLPADWPAVNTGWERIGDSAFRIDNPSRRFDRPTGWMIAGKLGTRRAQLGETKIAVSAPKGTRLRRMDVLTFLNVVWPELQQAFQQVPPALLIVGGDDPLWRGGLSAPNSLFYHADRPLVSENGTSSLIHELVHVVTRIRGADNDDWIAEGIAEFYSVELLYRAGGMTQARRDSVFAKLAQWGSTTNQLAAPTSTGARTARAAVLFNELDQEIRRRSDNRNSLDDIARRLQGRKVTEGELRQAVEELLGAEAAQMD